MEKIMLVVIEKSDIENLDLIFDNICGFFDWSRIEGKEKT